MVSDPQEVAVVPSECKATWKALPVGYLMYSVLPFGKRQRKMVTSWLSSQNLQGRSDSTYCFHAEYGARRLNAGKAACHGCVSRMVLKLQCILLLPQLPPGAGNSGVIRRVNGFKESDIGADSYQRPDRDVATSTSWCVTG